MSRLQAVTHPPCSVSSGERTPSPVQFKSGRDLSTSTQTPVTVSSDDEEAEPAGGAAAARGVPCAGAEETPRQGGKTKKRRFPNASERALELFKGLPQEERLRRFWTFVLEAVRGENSEKPFCRDYQLGGILPLIADVSAVAQEVLLPFYEDLGEQLWRVLMVVWLGGGGPGMSTFRHLTRGSPLCGEPCPRDARLPPLRAARDVDVLYEHLLRLRTLHGMRAVLSGDGIAVRFRFAKRQGVAVLRAWRRCALEWAEEVGNSPREFAKRGPMAFYKYLTKAPQMGDLAAKEVFCYLYAAHPEATDVDLFVPVGPGAMAGGAAVAGTELRDAGLQWHEIFARMAREVPDDLAEQLAEAIKRRAAACPFRGEARLPGARRQLQQARVTAADVEVCMCFFMNYLRAMQSGKAPAGWSMLRRGLWGPPAPALAEVDGRSGGGLAAAPRCAPALAVERGGPR